MIGGDDCWLWRLGDTRNRDQVPTRRQVEGAGLAVADGDFEGVVLIDTRFKCQLLLLVHIVNGRGLRGDGLNRHPFDRKGLPLTKEMICISRYQRERLRVRLIPTIISSVWSSGRSILTTR